MNLRQVCAWTHVALARQFRYDHASTFNGEWGSMTAWVLVAVFVALFFLMLALYRRSIRESSHLLTFTLFVLLDENVYHAQRDSLHQFIASAGAKDAMELASKVRTSTTQLANRLADKITLGCHAAIWNARQKPQ